MTAYHTSTAIFNGCGQRELWKHKKFANPDDITKDEKRAFASVEVDHPDLNICVWRLFDVNQTSEFGKLKYQILYDEAASANVEFVLFDYNLATNSSRFTEDQEDKDEDLIVVLDMIE